MNESALNLFTTLDQDFRAEVIAAEMVEQGIEPDMILILMLGALKRSFSKDVASIEEELSEYDHKEYQVLKTPREGIYDMLPEGLFHHPTSHKSAKTEKEIIKIMKVRKEEERTARKFFVPFEATINHQRMQMALYENRLDKRSHYDDLVSIFSSHWEIFQYLDPRQANIFIHLIPILHDVRDDHPVIEKIIEMIFLLPVQVNLRSELPLMPADASLTNLGAGTLGVDFTTGNLRFDDGADEVHIKIGPLSKETLQQFVAGTTNSKILQLLIDYLLPIHVEIITDFDLAEGDRELGLSDDAGDDNSMLGEDTFL